MEEKQLDYLQIGAWIILTLVALKILIFLAIAGFRPGRLMHAVAMFFQGLQGKKAPGPTTRMEAGSLSPEPFRLLKLLQAESRLLDLLMEDLSGFDDATIGASVRGVHAKARKILRDTVEMVPIISGNEGDSSRVEPGFDPAAIRLVGAVSGLPPFEGRICHPGWRVKSHKIPVAQPGASGLVLEQAEIELT